MANVLRFKVFGMMLVDVVNYIVNKEIHVEKKFL